MNAKILFCAMINTILIKVANTKLEINETDIKSVIAKKLKISSKDVISFSYYKKAIDARDKNHVFFLCHFLVEFSAQVINKVIKNKDVKKHVPYVLETSEVKTNKKVYVIGTGPSGLFASYVLALNGIKSEQTKIFIICLNHILVVMF